MSRSKRRLQKRRKEINIVEHIHVPVEAMPDRLLLQFPQGVCTVWANHKFAGAIPASGDQTSTFANLLKGGHSDAYMELRDRLCGPTGYDGNSTLFGTAMGQLRQMEHAGQMTKKKRGILDRLFAKKKEEVVTDGANHRRDQNRDREVVE